MLISLFLSLISCNKKKEVGKDSNLKDSTDEFNVAETKEIILGNAVDSVVFTTRAGEKIIIDQTEDFYEILEKIGELDKFEIGKKYSYIAETQLENQSKFFVNGNVYYMDGAQFREFRTRKDGKDAFATEEVYDYQIQLGNGDSKSFVRIMYEDDKAFGGVENTENGQKVYRSDSFPMMPQQGSELGEMYTTTHFLLSGFSCSGSFDEHGQYETFVTREYELYENYIVFKQTAPFLYTSVGVGQDPNLLYVLFSNTNCSITQEAYYNVKTGEIELIKLYGNTSWYTPEYFGKNLEIILNIYIHDIDKIECEQKIDNLIDYVKSNSN